MIQNEVEIFCCQCNKFVRRVSTEQKTYQEKHGIGYIEFCSNECRLLWRKANKDGNPQTKTLTGGEALKELRIKRGYNQNQIASALGIGQGNYSKLENGSRPISVKMAKRLGEYFAVDYKKFLRGL